MEGIMALIEVSHVSKEYEVIIPQPGARNVLKNIFLPNKKTVHAVNDVSFTIQEGELVGFIGENGLWSVRTKRGWKINNFKNDCRNL